MREASGGCGTRTRAIRMMHAVCGGAVATLLLAGCVSGSGADSSETPTAAATAPATATPATPDAPAVDPDGTAEDNLEYFTSVVTGFLAASPDANGRDIIDHLVASGFDKAEMELTADTTAVGLEADNIQFSVRMNGTCLIGQNGNVGVHTVTAPLLATGTCLVGNTRAIDW
jgi:hypothetical protein